MRSGSVRPLAVSTSESTLSSLPASDMPTATSSPSSEGYHQSMALAPSALSGLGSASTLSRPPSATHRQAWLAPGSRRRKNRYRPRGRLGPRAPTSITSRSRVSIAGRSGKLSK